MHMSTRVIGLVFVRGGRGVLHPSRVFEMLDAAKSTSSARTADSDPELRVRDVGRQLSERQDDEVTLGQSAGGGDADPARRRRRSL